MDKFKKIGLTALATSLVASSGYAAEVTIAGAAGFTYSTQSGNSGVPATDHGRGFGVDNSMTFNMSGEMDNGWSVAAHTAMTDQHALTTSAVALTMGDLGKITSGYGYGGNSASFDEETPRAYEQVDDGSGGGSTSMNLVGSKNDNGSLNYTSPAIDLAGMSATLYLGYTPVADDVYVVGGATKGVATMGAGRDAGLAISHDSGLSAGIYGAERERNSATLQDAFEGTWYVNYSMGPVSIGYQESYSDSGVASATAAAASDKSYDTSPGIFEANQYAIAFNVNDDLSVSYQKVEDTYDNQGGVAVNGGAAIVDATMDIKSISAAYSMGSMSIKAYRTTTDNPKYNTKGGSVTVNEIALGLSF
jgi:outer membrane protein OmpU